jgi:hypothetical protein
MTKITKETYFYCAGNFKKGSLNAQEKSRLRSFTEKSYFNGPVLKIYRYRLKKGLCGVEKYKKMAMAWCNLIYIIQIARF